MSQDKKEIDNSALILFLKWFFSTVISSAVIILTIIPGVMSIWEIRWVEVVSHSTISYITLILFCTTMGLLVAFYRLFIFANNNIPDKADNHTNQHYIGDVLLDGIQEAFEDNRWTEVIKIGKILSRPLWIIGKYELRVKIGRLVETAASHLGNEKVQAESLIDDLGWTNHELNNTTEAIENIKHGLKLAQNNDLNYLAYKACRHLSGIYLKKGMFEDGKNYLTESYDFAKQIKETDIREKAEAGYLTNLAIFEKETKNFDSAIKHFDIAIKKYRDLSDFDREAKLFHFIGDTYYEWGKPLEAYDIYRKGLSYSEREGRKDGVLKNSIGIAKISLARKNYSLAKNAYLKAAKAAEGLGNHELHNELLFKHDEIK